MKNQILHYTNIPSCISFVDLTPNHIRYQLSNLQQLTFEVTDACNLHCAYCGYGEFYFDHDKRENKMLPVEKAIRIIDYLVEFWNSDLNVSENRNVYISFYGGEPLLNMPFINFNAVKTLPNTFQSIIFV